MTGTDATLRVPERTIPVPTSVSAEAQAILSMPPPIEAPTYPPLDDLDAWRSMIAEHDKAVGALVAARVADAPVTTQELDLDGARVYDINPLDADPGDDRVYLDIHGGAFIHGAGETCRAMGTGTATRMGRRVWAVDYRMPPDHPFPAGLDDCLAAYRALLEEHPPRSIVVGGASAGGNLAAATVVRARDEGLPRPAAAVLITPAVDLTESGDSLQTNRGLDPLIPGSAQPAFLLYAGGHDLADPSVSPLYADLARGFPPTILTTGTRDMLLSDTVRMHRALRAAGVTADLHVTRPAATAASSGWRPRTRRSSPRSDGSSTSTAPAQGRRRAGPHVVAPAIASASRPSRSATLRAAVHRAGEGAPGGARRARPARRTRSDAMTTDTELRYDPYDREIDADPYPIYRRLRDESPLYYNEQYDFYAVSRFDDVQRGLVDRETYSSARGSVLEFIKANIVMPPGVVIFEDPPQHTAHRGLLSRVFTPTKVNALEPKIREFCARALDPLVGAGRFDFVADLGAQLPMRTIGMLLGVPERDQEEARDLANAALRTEPGQPMAVAAETMGEATSSPTTSTGGPATRPTT